MLIALGGSARLFQSVTRFSTSVKISGDAFSSRCADYVESGIEELKLVEIIKACRAIGVFFHCLNLVFEIIGEVRSDAYRFGWLC